MQRMLKQADPGKPDYIYKSRADDVLKSGKGIPVKRLAKNDEPVYKVVKTGEIPSPYTPFWLNKSQLAELRANPAVAGDRLGLPKDSISHNGQYAVWEMRSVQQGRPVLFQSTIAPTVEGEVVHGGGGVQSLVLNRNEWQQPVQTGGFP
jgi:hypothetical protein